MPFDEAKLHAFVGQFVADVGAAVHATMVVLGRRLGLYRALTAGPLTAHELAERAGTAERYVREWLCQQAASGYVDYSPATGTFDLPAEHAFALCDEAGLAYLPGGFEVSLGIARIAPRLEDAFRTGAGIAWNEYPDEVFDGVALFYAPGYRARLVGSWLPALAGVTECLHAGARVADVGCGHGASTILMAQAFPRSTFAGFDFHHRSIERARAAAGAAGVADRVEFTVAAADGYPGPPYDLITVFDALHDMGDPVGAATHIRGTLADGGSLMLVEPAAGDHIEDNLHPIGRLYYGASVGVCLPTALSQAAAPALGGQCGEAGLRDVLAEAGFTTLRRVAQTPFNIIYQAQP